MSEEKLEVINKSIDLMRKTFTETTNRKKCPQKYITLTRRMQERSLDIYEKLKSANQKDVNYEKAERIRLQTEVISHCDTLSVCVELLLDFHLISAGTVEEWQELISAVKYMTIAWRKKS